MFQFIRYVSLAKYSDFFLISDFIIHFVESDFEKMSPSLVSVRILSWFFLSVKKGNVIHKFIHFVPIAQNSDFPEFFLISDFITHQISKKRLPV